MARPDARGAAAAGAAAGDADHITIGDLAAEYGVSTRTVRFYESEGLIKPHRHGAIRCFCAADRVRLMLILRFKNLGFSLEDVRHYLALYDADPGQHAHTRHLMDSIDGHLRELNRKLADIERAIVDLKALRAQCLAELRAAGRDD